jgi:hypothetical protein
VFCENFFVKKTKKTPVKPGVIVHKSLLDALKQCKDIRKQADGAKIQHSNNHCQGCLLSNMTDVKVFHEMEFKRLIGYHYIFSFSRSAESNILNPFSGL